MTVYKGNNKIRDRSTFGIYKGNRPIKRIYKGSQLVYQFESYEPESTLVNITNGQSATVTLKKGVYQLYAVGAGGALSYWGVASGVITQRGGASGGAVEGTFYLSEPKNFVCYASKMTGGTAGTTPEKTTIKLDGTDIVTCTAGRNGYDSLYGGGTGGAASFTSALGSLTCVATTGLNTGTAGTPNGSASVSAKKWGAGGNAPSGEYTYGGIIIQYLRYEP